jgi:hypothetical protein
MNSKFINLTDYCVLEYKMTPLSYYAPEIINSDFFFVKNANLDLYQIYNDEASATTTRNTRGVSVVPIGGSRLIKVDITQVPIYTQYDTNIIETPVSNSLTSTLVMDTMRFHFASGFNFTEVENIVLGAKQKLNNLKQVQLANVLVDSLTAQSLLTFNNKPLFLANTIYDKYIDIKIPSCAYLNQNFDLFGPSSFEHVFTEGAGLIKNSPITVSLIEAVYEDFFADNNVTYESYRVNRYFEAAIAQTNEFDNLGAIIQEASDGDYIEFYATWNGEFPNDLISILNSRGADQQWIIVHQLQVYEQIGTAFVPSGNIVHYQEDSFDGPLSYRPILKDAGFAISMSIDYTMRLLNKLTGEQIVRESSYSLMNPNKYGKKLAKIALLDSPQSMKVYNKIVQSNIDASSLFRTKSGSTAISTPTTTTVKEIKVGVPIFYKQENIRISHKNALLTSSDSTQEVIYGQGELTLPIDPTDNYIKFTIYEADKKDPTKQAFANLNNNSTFRLNFGSDTILSYESLKDPSVENPSRGQIAFRVPKDQAKKILQSTDQLMYITLIGEDGSESLMYTGKWLPSSEYATILKAADAAKSTLLNDPQTVITGLQNTIRDLQTEINSLKGRVVAQSIVNTAKVKETYQNINALSANVPPASLTSSPSNPSTTVPSVVKSVDVAVSPNRRTQQATNIQSI